MKYKPCCKRRCLLGSCEIRESGGCYCVCRLVDNINIMKGVIDGTILDHGCLFIPDEEKRKEYLNRKSEEEREKQLYYRNVEAPEILIKLQNSLESYLQKDASNGN